MQGCIPSPQRIRQSNACRHSCAWGVQTHTWKGVARDESLWNIQLWQAAQRPHLILHAQNQSPEGLGFRVRLQMMQHAWTLRQSPLLMLRGYGGCSQCISAPAVIHITHSQGTTNTGSPPPIYNQPMQT